MTRTLRIEVDEALLGSLQQTPEEMAGELRLAAAAKWYEMGKLSQENAAQLAGLSRADFIGALAQFRVSPLQESAEDILRAFQGD